MLSSLRKPHGILLVMVVVFALAWTVWTFFLLPASETPSMPDPAATAPATPDAN